MTTTTTIEPSRTLSGVTIARAPRAPVVTTHGRRVTITCPYCGQRHTHTVYKLGGTARHAPGCGMYRSTNDRATGYRITTNRKA